MPSWVASVSPSVAAPFAVPFAIVFARFPKILPSVAGLAFATFTNDLRISACAPTSSAACGAATASERSARSVSGSRPASNPSEKFCPACGTNEATPAPAAAPRLNVVYRVSTSVFSSGLATSLATFSTASFITLRAANLLTPAIAPLPATCAITLVPPVASAPPTVVAMLGAACPRAELACIRKPLNVGLS